ncbi:MAG TPA: DUF4178 domain-containing protein [Bryobacteraceae bacterium]|nr:DUF4178 domain-containing protein [Bryobacteraceae bacterium]
MPQVRALFCPNCGGTIQLRGYAQTVNAVCEHCLSVLDTKAESLRVIQQIQERTRIEPAIPLGSRGTFEGTRYEAIGFQQRSIDVDDETYSWREYLLFNPYKGYRYLTEYDGHWNYVRTLPALPVRSKYLTRPALVYEGRRFVHFQHAAARTTYVLGEFPWQVRTGETVGTDDFISPPYLLSAESTEHEVVYSLGTYTEPAAVWQAFGLQGAPPWRRGVFANQPSPYSRPASMWRRFASLTALLLVVLISVAIITPHERVLEQVYRYASHTPAAAPFVTPTFELRGRPSSVVVRVDTDIDNDAASFALALINDETGQVWDFGADLGYWHGRDEDGNWSEGRRNAAATVPDVPAGRYYLRVEPSIDEAAPISGVASDPNRERGFKYTLSVTRGWFGWWPFLVAFPLLLIPPIAATARYYSFEGKRWSESDYSTYLSS